MIEMLLYNNIPRKIYIYLIYNKEELKYKNNNKWFCIIFTHILQSILVIDIWDTLIPCPVNRWQNDYLFWNKFSIFVRNVQIIVKNLPILD